MNLYLRLLILIIRSYWKPRLSITDVSTLKFYVLPNDLDINMHMNNGRYNSIMDLGRVDIMLRTGVLKTMYKKGWIGIVGSIHTKFIRPLKLFQAYELHSQIVYWDEKWTWIEQRIYSNNKLVSSSLVQTLVRSKEGNISSSNLQHAAGVCIDSPEISEQISLLYRMEKIE